MEGIEGMSSGVTVKGEEAPDTYRVAARSENPSEFGGPTMAAVSPVAAPAPPPSTAPSPAPGSAPAPAPVSVAMPGSEMKKKRGRPRKYGPGGSLASALSPMPISSSIPLTGEFSTWKRGRGRPVDSFKKHHKSESESAGERVAYSVGANFTPHVITVNAGEDVTMKIISFSQQGSRAICILSANGAISNVTLRQPNSSGGTLTYEGRFEILSLTGSFMPTESGGTKSRSGGMSVSLAGPDGRVLGGGLAGLLVAAGPVQVLVGSFLPGHQQEAKPKKQRLESVQAAIPGTVNSMPREEMLGTNGGPNLNLTSSPSSFHGDSWASLNSMQAPRNLDIENRLLPSSEGGEARVGGGGGPNQ